MGKLKLSLVTQELKNSPFKHFDTLEYPNKQQANAFSIVFDENKVMEQNDLTKGELEKKIVDLFNDRLHSVGKFYSCSMGWDTHGLRYDRFRINVCPESKISIDNDINLRNR